MLGNLMGAVATCLATLTFLAPDAWTIELTPRGFCGPALEVSAYLKQGEHPFNAVAFGTTPDGYAFTLLRNDQDAWIVVMLNPNDRSACIPVAGDKFILVDEHKP